MNKPSTNSKWHYFRRQTRAALRDTGLLLREFQWPLLAFAGAVFGGGMLYNYLAIQAGESTGGLAKATYHVLGLVFLSPLGEFPNAWYLQIFYFLIPIIGISILAQGVADFGILLFNRRARSKEWEMAVASTFDNHIIVVGLGHLGYRVVQHLHSMEEEVVAIEINPQTDLAASVKDLGVPVIADDAARESILTAANIFQARAIMLCTQNDSLNLQIALKARDLNPNIQVVIRIFDDDFAHSLKEQFGFQAMSATATASPVFAAAAAGVDMTRPIIVEGRPLNLARMEIGVQSLLATLTVEEVEQKFNVSIVLIRHQDKSLLFHPQADHLIKTGDTIAVLGTAKEINTVSQSNG